MNVQPREWRGPDGHFVRLWPEHELDGKHISVVQYGTGNSTFADTFRFRSEAEARYDQLVSMYTATIS